MMLCVKKDGFYGLTAGKKYELVATHPEGFFVKNDADDVHWYPAKCFEQIDQEADVDNSVNWGNNE